MIRLKDMSTKDQVVIMAALFRHFDPWIIGAGTSIKSQQIRQIHWQGLLSKLRAYVATGRQAEELLVVPIRFGWNKAIRIINLVLLFITKTLFRYNQRQDGTRSSTPRDQFRLPSHGAQVLHKYESRVVRGTLKAKHLDRFMETDRILRFKGTVENETLFRF